MRRLARTVLALQLAATCALAIDQVSASAQPSPSPSPTASPSSAAPSEPSPAASSPGPGAGETSPSPSEVELSSAPPPAATSPTPTPSASATPAADGRLSIVTGSKEVVAQVGDLVHYEAVVTNEGSADLQRVFVVGFLPGEVTFVSAELLPEVEATLYQRVGDDEYVTWNVGDIAARDAIRLSWTARVSDPGDMTAVSAVRAVADGARRQRRESYTYLATAANLGGPNPAPQPTTTRVVSYERVPTGSTLGASSEPGAGAVPDTGFDASLIVGGAVLLVLAGALMCWMAAPGPRRHRRVALALAAMALLAACTSGRDIDRATPEPTGSPEVKGRRIGPDGRVRDLGGDRERDDGSEDDQVPDPGVGDVPEAEPADEPTPAPDATTGGFDLVRTVDVIPVDAFLDPVQQAASHPGHQSIGYLWTGSELEGYMPDTSPDDALVLIETTVRDDGVAVETMVTMTNTSDATPVRVEGRLGLGLRGSVAGSLTAAPIRLTLMPGGSTSASFRYDLPHGLYFAQGFFRAL